METKCPNCTQRLRVPDHLKNPLLRCPSCQNEFRLRSASKTPTRTDLEPDPSIWRPQPVSPSPSRSNGPLLPDLPSVATSPASAPFAPAEVALPYDRTLPSAPSRPARKSPAFEGLKGLARGSLGTISLVVVLFLLKGGPRFAQQFFRERPPQPQRPAEFEVDNREAIQRQVQEIQDRIARERNRQQQAVEGLPAENPPGDTPQAPRD